MRTGQKKSNVESFEEESLDSGPEPIDKGEVRARGKLKDDSVAGSNPSSLAQKTPELGSLRLLASFPREVGDPP